MEVMAFTMLAAGMLTQRGVSLVLFAKSGPAHCKYGEHRRKLNFRGDIEAAFLAEFS